MKKKLLLSLLATLGFVGCEKSEEIPEIPLAYGPNLNWTEKDFRMSTHITNEKGEAVNGIRVVSSYLNRNDSLITDTAYTRSYEWVDGRKTDGRAISLIQFGKYPPKSKAIKMEYTDVDGEKNGSYHRQVDIVEAGNYENGVILSENKKEE